MLVDTPGSLPGLRPEAAEVIRHGAQLVRAFAGATGPRESVVLRKAFGGAHISMNSKGLGADAAFAWIGAEIGTMAPRGAVAILHRAELNGAGETGLAGRLADRYRAESISASRALGLGLLDAIIPPRATRDQVISALSAAAEERSHGVRAHT